MTERHSDRGRAQRDALADVLAQGAVEMGFQPIVELATDGVIGWEALARGPHGTPLEYPDALFEAARAAGRLEELDWLCQRRALAGALAAGPEPSHVLFLNLEAGATGFLPLELRALYSRATSQMTVAVEVTERALCARPAALLGHVADMRALGCAIALDDVGTEPSSLAMMALLRPDVVKLDLELVSTKPELSDLLAAVAGHDRAMAATLVVERVERTEQVDFAQAIGAQLGQGWLFGRRAPLEDAPPAPAGPVVRRESRPDPRDTAPFALVAATRAPHVAGEALVGDVAREVEEQARAAGGQALLVAAFGEAQRFTPDLRERYAGLARDIAFCGAIAHDMATEPAPGVRGGSLDASDPLSHDLTVAVVAPGFAAAIAAHDLGPGEPEDRRMAYTVTHDRDLATDAAAALMSRITG